MTIHKRDDASDLSELHKREHLDLDSKASAATIITINCVDVALMCVPSLSMHLQK